MELTIMNIPAISAIYYALLQCGYEFYAIERDAATVEALRGFLLHEGIGCDFLQEQSRRLAKFTRIGRGQLFWKPLCFLSVHRVILLI